MVAGAGGCGSDCEFRNGFKKVEGLCSLTCEESRAILYVVNALAGFVLAIISYAHAWSWAWMAVGAIQMLVTVAIFAQRPIRLVHFLSSFITSYVRTQPFLDRFHHFPNCKELEDPIFLATVKKEMQQVLANTRGGKDIRFTKETFNEKENAYIGRDTDGDRGWRLYTIKLGSSFSDHAKRDFPTLCRALAKMPEVGSCAMSMLDGDTEIPMHTGYFKGLMRYMLPLQVPEQREKCFLSVNGFKYSWEEGVGVLWDDMFPHRVENRTDQVRIVLYMDIKRGDLPAFLDAIVHFTTSEMEKSKDVQAEITKSERKVSIAKNES